VTCDPAGRLLRGQDPPPARAVHRGAEQLRAGRDR